MIDSPNQHRLNARVCLRDFFIQKISSTIDMLKTLQEDDGSWAFNLQLKEVIPVECPIPLTLISIDSFDVRTWVTILVLAYLHVLADGSAGTMQERANAWVINRVGEQAFDLGLNMAIATLEQL